MYAHHPDLAPVDNLLDVSGGCCFDCKTRLATGTIELRSGGRYQVCEDCYEIYWADNVSAGFFKAADAGQMTPVHDIIDPASTEDC